MLEYSVKSGSPEKQRSACLVVGVFESRRLSAPAEAIDQASDGLLGNLLRRGDMDGEAGDTLLLHAVPGIQAERVLLVGLGKERQFDLKAFRKAMAASVTALKPRGGSECVNLLTELEVRGADRDDVLKHAVLAVEDALYEFNEFKSESASRPRRPLRKITLMISSRRDLTAAETAIREATTIAAGMRLARDLANRPGNVCTPEHLANQARELGQTCPDLAVEVLDESRMETLGMGALLAVARGSRQPPRFIVMEHTGLDDQSPPIVLVGKGITFDSGGISIK
ncbi:MAG: M17 family peptidase N-terminal domain-containing protein, partial [Halothiobacillaceae bacterium]